MMRFLGWALSSLVLFVVIGAVAALVALDHFSQDLPDYSQLADYEPPITTRLHAADGRLMEEYATENRIFVPIDAIPDTVVQAFVSAEDQNFHSHPGVDPIGIARAAVTNIRNIGTGRRPVGASTITQQVAKNFLLTNEVSITRKIREALLAFRLEEAFTKRQILELYLNEIYLGRGAYGVAAASMAYFDKPLADLTLEEAAYLAALPKAPNNYHPIRRREAAIARRNYVLDRMLDDGVIDAATATDASRAPLEVTSRDPAEVVEANYFAEEVRREIAALYGESELYQGGLSVRTTMDPDLQDSADRALRDGLLAYDRRHGWRGPVTTLEGFDDWPDQLAAIETPAGAGDWRLGVALDVTADSALIGFADRSRGVIPMDGVDWARPWREEQRVGPAPSAVTDVLALGDVVLTSAEPNAVPIARAEGEEPLPVLALEQIPEVEGAIVALDPHTGRVLAMRGGWSFEQSEFNRATQALRQPGSAIKPFVYLSALEAGYTPSTIILDSPIAVDQGEGLAMWRPRNYSGDQLGPVPLRVGIERSRNLMTVRILLEIGLERVKQTTETFGVYQEMQPHYSMALGAGETTPIAMTTAYAMLANGGRRIVPSFIDRIQNRHGDTIFRHDDRSCAGCVDIAWNGQETPILPDDREQIADPISIAQIVSIMQGVVQRGTATRLSRLGVPLAGKTGTTNDAFDTWFVGFTPDLVVGVFVGFDNPRTLGPGETGSSVAVPIFGQFMEEALDGVEVPPFRIPPGVSMVQVDPRTGLRVDGGGIYEIYR
ncbi:MAG: PBP1A family penicillin-binding protein, partial [Deinococcus-Thermus bacterium]|nr:PBP1A family penicillin-binding protein [Deinococcota bacterium]